jgi:hypothetical protein
MKTAVAPASGPALPLAAKVGRWSLLAWLSSGLALEGLHLWKAPFFLEDALRREFFVLAHAHGGLLAALTLVVFVLSARLELDERRARTIDRLVSAGAVLVPLGFLLGGLWHTEADPGLLVALAPIGALCWMSGLFLVARARLAR